MFDVTVKVGNKRVLWSRQFHVAFGEPLEFTVTIDDITLPMAFSQDFEPAKPEPSLLMKAITEKEGLHYILRNLNQHEVSTGFIPFYHRDKKTYYYQLTAKSLGIEITSTSTWLYTMVFYEEDTNYERR